MNYPRFFAGCTTPDEIKKRYRELAFEHHPDRGGNTATMQAVNAQYEQVLRGKSGTTYTNRKTRKEYTYTYNHQAETDFMAMLARLLSLKMTGVQIEVIGSWVWVSGNTRKYKELLGKAGLGLKFSGKRKMWYFTATPSRHRRHASKASMDDLRVKYGAFVAQDA